MGRGLAAHRYPIIFLGYYLALPLGGSPAVPTLLRLESTAPAAAPDEVRHQGIAVVHPLVDLVGGVGHVNEGHYREDLNTGMTRIEFLRHLLMSMTRGWTTRTLDTLELPGEKINVILL